MTTSERFYDSDLADVEWQIIEPLLPAPKPIGNGGEVGVWEQINDALVRQVRRAEGCAEEPSLVVINSHSVSYPWMERSLYLAFRIAFGKIYPFG